jgi:hypothetical protein
MNKFNIKEGFVISREEERKQKIDCKNISVTRGNLYNFDNRIYVVNSSDVKIQEVTGRANTLGILIDNSKDVTIGNKEGRLNMSDNDIGVLIRDSNNVTVTSFYSFRNRTAGIGVSGENNSIKLEDGGVSAIFNGVFLDDKCKNIEINNFNIRGDLNRSGAGKDVVSYSDTNVFLNCRNPSLSGNRFTEGVDSSLTKANSYQALVQDSLGRPIVNAVVNVYDRLGNLESRTRTGADGKTPKISLVEYINRGGEKEQFAPYVITAEKGNFSDSHVYDPNNLYTSCGGTADSCMIFNTDEGGCWGQSGCDPYYLCEGGDSTVSCDGKPQQRCIQYGCTWNAETSQCEGYVPCEHVASSDCTNYGCTDGSIYLCLGTASPCSDFDSDESGCNSQSGCLWKGGTAYDKFVLPE